MADSKTIMLVDDEEEICELLSFFIQRDGYNVVTAKNGNAALKFLRENQVDMIISDIRMPHGDGIFLLTSLRNEGNLTPLLFISGYSDVSESDAIQKGAVGLLPAISETFEG